MYCVESGEYGILHVSELSGALQEAQVTWRVFASTQSCKLVNPANSLNLETCIGWRGTMLTGMLPRGGRECAPDWSCA